MNSKSTLKNFLKFSLGIGLFIPLLKSQPSNAATPCPANDSVTTMSGQANPCFTTPEKLEVTFFEIGFCVGSVYNQSLNKNYLRKFLKKNVKKD